MNVYAKLIGTIFTTAVLGFSGCGFNSSTDRSIDNSSNNKTVKTVDVDNYTVTGERFLTFDTPPKKVIVSGLEETEMVLAFARTDSICAVYGYYDLKDFVKPQYKSKLDGLRILQRGQVNTENIMAMQPDLIIAEQCSFVPASLRSTKLWQERGIKTYVPINTNSPTKHLLSEDIETEYAYIADFGKIFNNRELADAIIQDAKDTMSFFEKYGKSQNDSNPTVLIVEQFGKEIASYDKTKLGGKIVTQLGGHIPETAPLIGQEELRAINPDILFVVCSDGDKGKCRTRLISSPIFQELNAVKDNHVYSLELETVYAPGLRIKDGIEKIGLSLYPTARETYLATQENTINPSYDDWFE